MKSLIVFFIIFNFVIHSAAFGGGELSEVRIIRTKLTAGAGSELVIVGERMEMFAINDYGRPKVKLFSIELNKEDAAEIFQEANRTFLKEMHGQNRKSEFLGGVQFFFSLKSADMAKTFRLTNVRFSELDNLTAMIDSYLPNKYRIKYQETLKEVVPVNAGKTKGVPAHTPTEKVD